MDFSHKVAVLQLEPELTPVGPAGCHVRVGRDGPHLGEGELCQVLEERILVAARAA